jgi:Flp pilus assembly pilin Flp
MFLKPYLWLLARRESGQTMAEYAVVLGVITLAVVGVFTALSGGISSAISNVTSNI